VSGQKLCIGLTGRMAAGKGEAVRILSNYGFQYISLSDVVRQEAAKIQTKISRGQLQDVGNHLRKEGGAGILGQKVRKMIETAITSRWVIDGIRNPAEVVELKKIDVFYLIGIETEMRIILARLRARGRQTDLVTESEIRAILEREWGNGEPDSGQQVGECMAAADFIIANNGTLDELQIGLDAVLKKVGAGHE
jgi:dephospho-CoA kinase